MALNPLQKLLNAFDKSTIEYGDHDIIIYGKRATIQYLGLTVDQAFRDLSQCGESKQIARKGYKRARYYGDAGGYTVPATTVRWYKYPSNKGGALPGRPFTFEALTDTAGDTRGRKVVGTLSIQGNFGAFISYMLEHRPPKSVRIQSPDGAWLAAPLLSETDFDALP